jgi:hypothetical protein
MEKICVGFSFCDGIDRGTLREVIEETGNGGAVIITEGIVGN